MTDIEVNVDINTPTVTVETAATHIDVTHSDVQADVDLASVTVETDTPVLEVTVEQFGVIRIGTLASTVDHASIVDTRIAAVTLSGHRAVTPLPDETVAYADPATIGNQPVWVTTTSAVAGDTVHLAACGDVAEPSWTWGVGNVYLAANGVLTQTEPASGALVIVGVATAPTVLFVDRQPTIDL